MVKILIFQGSEVIIQLRSLSIIIKLYEKFFTTINEGIKFYNNSLIMFKLCDLTGTVKVDEYFTKESEGLLNFLCLNCKELINIKIDSFEFNNFRYGWSFKCPKCKEDINICRYMFLEDYNTK